LGHPYGRRFGSKTASTNWKEGDEVGVGHYKAGSERVTTHMEATGRYVKDTWLVSGWATGWQVKTIVL